MSRSPTREYVKTHVCVLPRCVLQHNIYYYRYNYYHYCTVVCTTVVVYMSVMRILLDGVQKEHDLRRRVVWGPLPCSYHMT